MTGKRTATVPADAAQPRPEPVSAATATANHGSTADGGSKTNPSGDRPPAKTQTLSITQMQAMAKADPPTAAQIAAGGEVSVQSARTVKVSTSGGRMEVTIDWRGSGPYSGRVYGSVTDTKADGQCAFVRYWMDGDINVISGRACPKGTTKPVSGTYKKRWRVLVSVCAARCSAWV